MTDPAVGRVPAMKAVWTEQLRVVGLAIRREGTLAAAVLGICSLALVAAIRIPAIARLIEEEGMGVLVFDPAEPPWIFAAVVAALLLPLVVWKGERRFGDTPLWSLPVDHPRHAVMKVAAGWVWLLAILGSGLAWVVLTVLAAGGTLGTDEIRLLVLDPVGAAAGADGATESVRWTTPWWEWALPFTAATAAYLVASTLVLATVRPLFWAAGLWVAGMSVLGVADVWSIGWIERAAELVSWFVGGDTFAQGVQLPTGRETGWWRLPSFGLWAALSAFWIGLGVAGVLSASARPREE